MHSIKCYSKYNMDLTIYCVFSVLLSVTANVYPNIPNQHVPNYVNYRQYVRGMYHQPEKYPQMSIYGDRFDSHGSYKFNPHIIPNCKTINHYICCRTKYTYICQPDENAQVSDTTNTDSGETDHTIVTTTVLPDSTILITLENVETTGIVEGTDTNGGDLTAEYKISPFPDTTVTSGIVFSTKENVFNQLPNEITSSKHTTAIIVPITSSLFPTDSTTITAVTNITRESTISSIASTSFSSSETNGIIDIAAPTSSELTADAVISISEPKQTSTISKTSGTNPAKEATSTSGTTYMRSGDDEITKYEEKTIDTSTISTDVDTDSEGSGSGNPIDMESGDDEITTEYEGNGNLDSTITTSISVLTTKAMETSSETSVSSSTLTTGKDEIIDIDGSSSSDVTAVPSNLESTTVIYTSTISTDVDTDSEGSGSGNPIDMESGDDEITTENEGSGITDSTITTSISVLTTKTKETSSETSVSSSTLTTGTDEIIDIDGPTSSDVTAVPSNSESTTVIYTSTISRDVDTDSEGSGSGNPIDMESGDDEITTEYEGSGITDSTITTSIPVLTTKTKETSSETSVSSSTLTTGTDEIIDIDGPTSSDVTAVPSNSESTTVIYTSTISTDVDTDSEGSGSGNPIDMESGDDESTTEYEGSGLTDSTITTSISVLTTKGSGEITDMEDGDGKITREYEGSGITLSTVSTTHTILTTTMKSLVTDTEETIDIDETSSEPTTLTSVLNTSPTEITGSGTGITDFVTDPDMEAGSGSGDMESGDSEIRTEYEGSTFGSTTKSAITTDISEIRDTMDPDLEGSATDINSSGDGVSDYPSIMFTNKNIQPPDEA